MPTRQGADHIHALRLAWLYEPAREFVCGYLILAVLFVVVRLTAPDVAPPPGEHL